MLIISTLAQRKALRWLNEMVRGYELLLPEFVPFRYDFAKRWTPAPEETFEEHHTLIYDALQKFLMSWLWVIFFPYMRDCVPTDF